MAAALAGLLRFLLPTLFEGFDVPTTDRALTIFSQLDAISRTCSCEQFTERVVEVLVGFRDSLIPLSAESNSSHSIISSRCGFLIFHAVRDTDTRPEKVTQPTRQGRQRG